MDNMSRYQPLQSVVARPRSQMTWTSDLDKTTLRELRTVYSCYTDLPKKQHKDNALKTVVFKYKPLLSWIIYDSDSSIHNYILVVACWLPITNDRI